MVKYTQSSSYATTEPYEYYLDLYAGRSIPKISTDVLFTINMTYNLRPDLLAFDLYDTSDLWWVFTQRNPDVLINPLLDFTTGTEIYIPTLETLKKTLRL